MRPAVGYADYRTPIRGLYQASSATHAGGGVTGLPGHHCVREILRDKKRKSRASGCPARAKTGDRAAGVGGAVSSELSAPPWAEA